MTLDLHSHTIHSDGLASPLDLARMSWAGGLTGLAVSDHDTTAHFEETEAACAIFGLEWVPAVELSAEVPAAHGELGEAAPRSVHLLGLWIDGDEPLLRAELARLEDARRTRALRMVARLNDHGAGIDPERVMALAGAAPATRPHVARVMVEAGLVATTGQAFAEWIAEGRPAYVPKGALDPVECVRLIRSAGGAAVLAHPTWGGVDHALLDRMCTAGLAGIEEPSDTFEPHAARRWRALAASRGLLLTRGSDYHGPGRSVTPIVEGTPVRTAEALHRRAEGDISSW